MFADKEKTDHRFSLCIECPLLIKKTYTCKKCGCFMKVKTKLSSSKCPIGKW